MPKYLVQGSYTDQGLKGLLKEGGSKRRAMVEQLANEMGGKLEAFYYAFGSDDFVIILDLPRTDVRFGSKAYFDTQVSMSALTPKADMRRVRLSANRWRTCRLFRKTPPFDPCLLEPCANAP